jgi:hypothetical protein
MGRGFGMDLDSLDGLRWFEMVWDGLRRGKNQDGFNGRLYTAQDGCGAGLCHVGAASLKLAMRHHCTIENRNVIRDEWTIIDGGEGIAVVG